MNRYTYFRNFFIESCLWHKLLCFFFPFQKKRMNIKYNKSQTWASFSAHSCNYCCPKIVPRNNMELPKFIHLNLELLGVRAYEYVGYV